MPAEQLSRVFSDVRMPLPAGVRFAMPTPEPKSWYVQFSDSAHVATGVEFLKEHKDLFDRVARRYPVPSTVLVAQLVIESACGQRAGDI